MLDTSIAGRESGGTFGRVVTDSRYHGLDNIYPLPNDTKEIIRLDDLHYMFYVHHGFRNVIPRISRHPHQILDLGTGSGRWVCEVAAQFPTARVVGLDLVPANPLYELSHNMEFNVADFNDGLVKLYPDTHFDLVHSRLIMAGLTKAQWPTLMDEVYKILVPGGWVQCTEFRGSQWYSDGDRLPKDSALSLFFSYLDRLCEQMDIYWNGYHLQNVIRSTGFQRVRARTTIIDVGNWRDDNPSEQLQKAREFAATAIGDCFVDFIHHMREREFVHYYRDPKKQSAFAQQVKAEMLNPAYRLYFDS